MINKTELKNDLREYEEGMEMPKEVEDYILESAIENRRERGILQLPKS